MPCQSRYGLILGLVLLAVAALPAGAMAAVTSNEACMACHGNPTLRIDREGQSISLYVNPEAYASSAHAANPCAGCHPDRTDVPHKGESQVSGCPTCHAEEERQYLSSSHGKAFEAGNQGATTCVSCHGSYVMGEKSRVDLKDPEQCLGCHQEIRRSYQYSFHGTAVKYGYNEAPSCADCHGAHNIRGPEDPESTVAPENVPRTCAKCHKLAQPNFAVGKEHVVPQDKEKSFPLWVVWKFFVALILFDTLKDGPIVLLELWRKLRRLGKR